MRRADALLATAAMAMLVSLVAVSWRATPDRTDDAVILYLVGGLLEVVGVITIGLDLRARRERSRRRDEHVLRLPAPSASDAAAWIGFGALLAGVVVGVAANILAATA